MRHKKHKVVIAISGKQDIKDIKKYILDNFKYREFAENFSKKIKKAALDLAIFPSGHSKIGFKYRGYDIYLKPYRTYLLFYIIDDSNTVVVFRVMQDGMNWIYLIKKWIKECGYNDTL